MHDIVLIEDLKSLKELSKYKKGFFLRKSSLFFKDSLQSSTVTVFVNKIEIIRSFEHINILNDMFMFFDVCENIDLIDSTLLKFLVLSKLGNRNDFNSILFFIIVIYCSVNFSIDTWSNRFIKCIILDVFDHLLIFTMILLLSPCLFLLWTINFLNFTF